MPPSEILRSRSSLFEAAAADGGSLQSLIDDATSGKVESFDLSTASSIVQQQFLTLSAEKKTDVLTRLATAPPDLVTINLSGAGLDNSYASALAALLRRPTLRKFNAERNNLTEVGLLELADELLSSSAADVESSVLADVSVANQRTALSTLATTRLLDAMAARTTIVRLGLGQLRDDGARKRHQQVTMANTEAKRLRRVKEQRASQSAADGEGTFSTPKRTTSFSRAGSSSVGGTGGGSGDGSSVGGGPTSRRVSGALLDRVASIESAVSAQVEEKLTIVDWAEEARLIAASAPCSSLVGASAEHTSTYTMTGNSHWLKATESERRGVVGAFASNTSVTSVAFANSAVGDALGALWGDVLLKNTSLTALNLESNAVSTNGFDAIARALAHGTTRLRELKLANQRVTYSQRCEEALAEALELNRTLLKLTLDHRSIRARDLATKYLKRNDDIDRPSRISRRQSEADQPTSPTLPRPPTAPQMAPLSSNPLATVATTESPPGAPSASLDHTHALTRARPSRRSASTRQRSSSACTVRGATDLTSSPLAATIPTPTELPAPAPPPLPGPPPPAAMPSPAAPPSLPPVPPRLPPALGPMMTSAPARAPTPEPPPSALAPPPSAPPAAAPPPLAHPPTFSSPATPTLPPQLPPATPLSEPTIADVTSPATPADLLDALTPAAQEPPDLSSPSSAGLDSTARMLPASPPAAAPPRTPFTQSPMCTPSSYTMPLAAAPEPPASSSEATTDSYDTDRRTHTSCCERVMRRLQCILAICGLESGQRRPLLSPKEQGTSTHTDQEAWGMPVDTGSEVDSSGSGSSRSGLLRRRAECSSTSSTHTERPGSAELEMQRADERV